MKARMSRLPPQQRHKSPLILVSSAHDAADNPTPRTRAERAQARRLLAVLNSGGDTRAAKIRRVRRSVRQSCYENQLKLSIAIDRMLAQLNAE
jgi:hypothetical protein